MALDESERQLVKHRRRWNDEQKRRIVAETTEKDSNIAGVARRYGISSNLLYRWRRLMGVGGKRIDDQKVDEMRDIHNRIASLEVLVEKQNVQLQSLLSSIVAAQITCR